MRLPRLQGMSASPLAQMDHLSAPPPHLLRPDLPFWEKRRRGGGVAGEVSLTLGPQGPLLQVSLLGDNETQRAADGCVQSWKSPTCKLASPWE